MDKLLRAEIVATIERVVTKAYETYNEVWLNDEEMSKHISILTKRWLRDHGHMLPRTQLIYTDKQGKEHCTSFVYPLHKIQAMIADGRIKELKDIS